MNSFVHPNHTPKTLHLSQQVKSFVDVFKFHLMSNKIIQIEFLLIIGENINQKKGPKFVLTLLLFT